MDYKNFYLAIRRYAKKKISRGAFLIDWEYAQRSQGISAAKADKNRGIERMAMA